MALILANLMDLVPQASGWVNAWQGEVVVRTHGQKEYRVPADGVIHMTELGAFIDWPGDDPGVFLPWPEVRAIEQVK